MSAIKNENGKYVLYFPICEKQIEVEFDENPAFLSGDQINKIVEEQRQKHKHECQ